MKKALPIAILAGAFATASITYLWNNASGTNNELALQAGIVTGAGVLLIKKLGVV